MVDQFINLAEPSRQSRDHHHYFVFVVDDPNALCAALTVSDVEVTRPQNHNFFDPWSNRIEIIEYRGFRFSKTATVSRAMGLGDIEKTEAAKKELARKVPVKLHCRVAAARLWYV
jgi:hypothetical protein